MQPHFELGVKKFEVENCFLATELDLLGGWMLRWMDGWMGVKLD
jgi:hypothetical protein